MMNNFDTIRKEGRLLMEFVRGSHLYNINTEGSDIDTGGVFISRPEQCIGNLHKVNEVSDARHDNNWYELNNFVHLAMKSNPTVLETLFIPKDKMLCDVHPYMIPLIENRDIFVTKRCFHPFFSYAKSQIEKARGLNKKITNPIVDRKTPIDFCYTIKGTGSEPLSTLLERNGMEPQYIGLQAVDHMHEVYLVYYDYAAHIIDKYKSYNEFHGTKLHLHLESSKMVHFHYDGEKNDDINMQNDFVDAVHSVYGQPIGYRGIVDSNSDSNELRLSSIPKGEQPICFICYNASGYSKHCREYKEFKEWEKNRNKVRYESNLNKNYDSKNMAHCFRMIHMAQEIASGKGIILDRSGIDRDFLLDVRAHKYEYDELISILDKDKDKMNQLMEESTIPEDIDSEFVNNILVSIRKEQLRKWIAQK